MPSHDPSSQRATRLHKFLAASGVASRRQCEQLMLAGRVTVDGREIRDLAFRIEPGRHEVRVDGELVHEQPKFYFAVNKPAGYVCTHRDPQGRPRAIDLVPIDGLALFTVGRLDESSEGLLLVTNDGDLAEKLARPAFHVKRTYRVEVAGHPTLEALELLKLGMHFAEGRFRVHSVLPIRTQGKNSWLELVLTEGRNREIRRLLARVGHKVLHLERIAFGAVQLGRLPGGEFRELTAKELAALREAVSRKGRRDKPPPRGRRTASAAPTTDEDLVLEHPDDESNGGDSTRPHAHPAGDARGAAQSANGSRNSDSNRRRRVRKAGKAPAPRESRRGAARFAGKKKRSSGGKLRRPGRG